METSSVKRNAGIVPGSRRLSAEISRYSHTPMARRWWSVALVLATLWAGPNGSVAALGQPSDQVVQVVGEVVDPTGAAIPHARVELSAAPNGPATVVQTESDGRFSAIPPRIASRGGPTRIRATAPGFSPLEHVLADAASPLRLVLQPAPLFESVNVTSSRTETPRADPTVTMSVLTTADLESRAAVTLDDALKLVPGFTLFRRTSSRVSNPTAQGVTVRGLGGTGSSRSLVLADGLPLNDAFGGWVYWDKLPQAAIERVEVLRGSGSDLYGADAVGGVVQILTRHPDRLAVQAWAEGGTLGTGRLSLFAGGRPRGWSFTAAGEWFTTDGYILVARGERGPIDTEFGSTHRSLLGSLGRQASNGWRVEGGANIFTEDRKNGTPVVFNATASRRGWLEAAGGLRGGLLSARVHYGTQGYDQSFSAVALDRRSEDLNRLQRIPTQVVGLGAQWVRPHGRHTWLFGAEGKFIDGRTQETRLAQGRVLGFTDDGGEQQTGSVFVQDTWAMHNRFTVVSGAHADAWHTKANNTSYDETLGAFNPRVSAAWVLSPLVSLRGSVYGAFRAPTLNELYRGFRTGNTQVQPNEALKPERLTGADWGLLVTRGAVSGRATLFWNALHDVITNVTLSRTPALITQQRQNADRVRSAGVELEAGWQHGAWATTVTAAIVDARFTGESAVRDNRVPQVPEAQFGWDLRYTRGGWTGSGQLRVTGRQFEDDLNLLTLRRATVMDLMVTRRVTSTTHTFLAVENAFDAEYDVGRTPILTVGLPRTVRGGVRIGWR